jgi:hypothetical protein
LNAERKNLEGTVAPCPSRWRVATTLFRRGLSPATCQLLRSGVMDPASKLPLCATPDVVLALYGLGIFSYITSAWLGHAALYARIFFKMTQAKSLNLIGSRIVLEECRGAQVFLLETPAALLFPTWDKPACFTGGKGVWDQKVMGRPRLFPTWRPPSRAPMRPIAESPSRPIRSPPACAI